ncbi:MAG: 8-oxo-dGTP diphosphatase [Spirochaeta sp.]|jgi:8-oxo-dGTP diphosphatase|nr:8-oxo-dGTP diphosphatase [Spirochaeta sp.]
MEFDWNTYIPADRAVLCFLRRNAPGTGKPEVLLIEKLRGLGAGKINGPGGKLETGETPAETAIRETSEEVGLVPENPQMSGTLRFAFADGYHLEVYVFQATAWSGTLITTPEAIPFWVREEDIPYPDMWADDQLWLPRVLTGQTVDAWMTFDGDTMTTWDLSFSDGSRLIGTDSQS